MKPLPLLVLIVLSLLLATGCKTLPIKSNNTDSPPQGTQTLTIEELRGMLNPPVIPLKVKIFNTVYNFIKHNYTALIVLAFVLTLWLAYRSTLNDRPPPSGLDDEQKAMLCMAADTLKDLTKSIEAKEKENILPFQRGN